MTDFSYTSQSAPNILRSTIVSPWIVRENPIYNTTDMDRVSPEWKISPNDGIMKTIIDEYIGFLQRLKGPFVISSPGLNCRRKYIADQIQKETPVASRKIPRSLII